MQGQASTTDPSAFNSALSEVWRILEVALYRTLGRAILAVLAWTAFATDRFLTSLAIGGSLTGSSQAASLPLTSTAVGVSTAYERLSQHILQTVKGRHTTQPRMASRPIIFLMGVIAGSKVSLEQSHSKGYLFATAAIPTWQAFTGGVL